MVRPPDPGALIRRNLVLLLALVAAAGGAWATVRVARERRWADDAGPPIAGPRSLSPASGGGG
ncbi:hypothetical protein AB0M46_36920 [Dactylosporangium sp. NPDC051485]|uniref:hypothetical protein n=1 Tax=Dactylosporangium sp. NPDC051485 TaxID=3154846 RepID=UPI0034272458